ncbi:MAG: Na+/H+ antiporter NhaC family protein [Clostridia bacterium]
MRKLKTRRIILAVLVLALVMAIAGIVMAEGGDSPVSPFANSFWALVPPIIAIALALITKEVYSSLFIGIVVGGLLYSNFNFEGTLTHVFVDGMVGQLSDAWNVGILIFLVVLGAFVALMNKAGGSKAFGEWARKRIKTRKGAQLSTILLGVVIFIDDYFNCLTVGSVMRPVTDSHNVSRAKLAYLIDATAAPVCIIAPISSWAAAVTGFVDGYDGLSLFIQAIPFNLYALLTITMMITLALMNFDFGPMRKHEQNAIEKNDLYTTPGRPYENTTEEVTSARAKVVDLVFPIVFLVIACVAGMVYTGGFFGPDKVSFIDAFSASDASVGLMLGSVIALVLVVIYYLIRRVLNFKQCMDCIPEGFRAMVPAIMILTFAWTLKSMTDSLGAMDYVANIVKQSAGSFISFLPAIVFLIAVGLSFATGTSWGTFGILIPIVVAAFNGAGGTIMIISISACMAGAVCGDHCSPISDTTIMASAGAQCDHVNHVSTQLPYAAVCAATCFVFYILAGFWQSYFVTVIAILAMVGLMFLLRALINKKAAHSAKA